MRKLFTCKKTDDIILDSRLLRGSVLLAVAVMIGSLVLCMRSELEAHETVGFDIFIEYLIKCFGLILGYILLLAVAIGTIFLLLEALNSRTYISRVTWLAQRRMRRKQLQFATEVYGCLLMLLYSVIQKNEKVLDLLVSDSCVCLRAKEQPIIVCQNAFIYRFELMCKEKPTASTGKLCKHLTRYIDDFLKEGKTFGLNQAFNDSSSVQIADLFYDSHCDLLIIELCYLATEDDSKLIKNIRKSRKKTND